MRIPSKGSTYGKPELTEIIPASGMDNDKILQLSASLERYSKHPLASAILQAAEKNKLPLIEATSVSEKPGQGFCYCGDCFWTA